MSSIAQHKVKKKPEERKQRICQSAWMNYMSFGNIRVIISMLNYRVIWTRKSLRCKPETHPILAFAIPTVKHNIFSLLVSLSSIDAFWLHPRFDLTEYAQVAELKAVLVCVWDGHCFPLARLMLCTAFRTMGMDQVTHEWKIAPDDVMDDLWGWPEMPVSSTRWCATARRKTG